jgi:RimJ/RimL family protein N-acetyltransferase
MATAFDIVKATLHAGWDVLRVHSGAKVAHAIDQTCVMVPIRSLGPNQRQRIATHLLSLDANDRYLRFGYAVQDEQILLYVEGLNFERDEIFGIFDRKLALLAVAHLAYGKDPRSGGCAEFGVSVVSKSRGRGYGARLFERAAMHAGNQGVQTLFIHALSENTAMLKIARAAGGRVQREGAESEAYLQLPQATLNSRVSEIVNDKIAEADYRFKRQSKLLRQALVSWQALPRSVRKVPKDQPL